MATQNFWKQRRVPILLLRSGILVGLGLICYALLLAYLNPEYALFWVTLLALCTG